MKEIEESLVKDEQRGEGLFTNNLFKQKFYADGRKPLSKFKKILLITAIVCAVLFFTNPSRLEYNEWAMAEAYNNSAGYYDENAAEYYDGDVEAAARAVANIMAVRKDYFIFSLYATKGASGKSKKVLGILSNFYPLP